MLRVLLILAFGMATVATVGRTKNDDTTPGVGTVTTDAETEAAEADSSDVAKPKEGAEPTDGGSSTEAEKPNEVGETAEHEDSPDGETPLNPTLLEALEIAQRGYQRMRKEITDYTCQLTKRERVDGRLFDHETMLIKVRHQRVEDGRIVKPFSVYVKFASPAKLKGREVIYVEGKNDDKLIVRNGGLRFDYITTSVAPDSPAALQQNRYPITEIGVMNLTARLIEVGQGKLQCANCEAKIASGASINDRPCTLIQVSHPVRRESQTFQMARIFVDDELQLPVRYSAYDWPKEEGGDPLLLEEYTYTDVKLNVGLTDWDFDHRNENYRFLKSFKP